MTKEQALSRSMKYCSLREYAATDMEIKLNDWGISVVESKWVMEQLFAHKFIDEFRLARSFANDKLRFNKWGKLKIRNNLQQKKVDSKAIVEALDQINPEAYLEILTEEITKKRKNLKETDDYRLRGKLYQFASGRGFEPDLIFQVIDNLLY